MDLTPLAGLTMYSALKKLDKYCQKGDYVAIVGAGGGLGHLYVPFIVFSRKTFLT